MAKSFLRKSKTPKSTLRLIERIVRGGFKRRKRRPMLPGGDYDR